MIELHSSLYYYKVYMCIRYFYVICSYLYNGMCQPLSQTAVKVRAYVVRARFQSRGNDFQLELGRNPRHVSFP